MSDTAKIWCASTAHILCGTAFALTLLMGISGDGEILLLLCTSLTLTTNLFTSNAHIVPFARYSIAVFLAIACLYLFLTINDPIQLVDPKSPLTNVLLGFYTAGLTVFTLLRDQHTSPSATGHDVKAKEAASAPSKSEA